MTSKYMDSLEDGLKVKSQILDELYSLSVKQKELLQEDKIDWDEFDRLVDEKSVHVAKVNKLDEGFEIVFAKVKEEVIPNKALYKEQIEKMQLLIKEVTEKSTGLMALEQRNKKLVEDSFDGEKRRLASGRVTNKVASGYYNSMNKINYIDPQLMDQKK